MTTKQKTRKQLLEDIGTLQAFFQEAKDSLEEMTFVAASLMHMYAMERMPYDRSKYAETERQIVATVDDMLEYSGMSQNVRQFFWDMVAEQQKLITEKQLITNAVTLQKEPAK